MAGQEIGHRGTGAAIGDELDLRAGELLQQDAGHLRRRVLVDEGGLAGIGLQPGDQRLEVVRRQRLLADQELRIDGNQADRLEVLLQVIGEGIDHAANMGVPLADVDGVAIGRGARDAADGDATAGAADVLDDDRLAERRPHALGQYPRRHVGRAAGGERHYQRNGTRRIGLRPRDARDRRQRGSTRGQIEKISTGKFHNISL